MLLSNLHLLQLGFHATCEMLFFGCCLQKFKLVGATYCPPPLLVALCANLNCASWCGPVAIQTAWQLFPGHNQHIETAWVCPGHSVLPFCQPGGRGAAGWGLLVPRGPTVGPSGHMDCIWGFCALILLQNKVAKMPKTVYVHFLHPPLWPPWAS